MSAPGQGLRRPSAAGLVVKEGSWVAGGLDAGLGRGLWPGGERNVGA